MSTIIRLKKCNVPEFRASEDLTYIRKNLHKMRI